MDQKIEIVLRQTTYSREVAMEKLSLFDMDEIKVIKDFLGIKDKKEQVKSVNQEIYKQLRNRLNTAMKDYNERVKDKN